MIITVMGFVATACMAGPIKTEYVGQIEILEAPVVVIGSTVAGRNWVKLEGDYKTRYLAPDSRYRDIEIGDILIMACTGGNCWVWTVQKKEADDE